MDKSLALLATIVSVQLVATTGQFKLDPLNPPDELSQVIDSLESNMPLKSEFEEIRSNRFQKHPGHFRGTIFWHSEHGLSLEYTSPSDTKINVNTGEIIVYRKGKKPRRLEVSEDDQGMSFFFKLFTWDTDWIARNFILSAEVGNGAWEIQLIPKDEAQSRKLNRVDLNGTRDLLTSIRLDLSGGREVRISLYNQVIPWNPDRQTLMKQFEIEDVMD